MRCRIKCYDVVGYAGDGSVYCTDCAGDGAPIFAGSEWDYAPACDACGELLDVVVLKS